MAGDPNFIDNAMSQQSSIYQPVCELMTVSFSLLLIFTFLNALDVYVDIRYQNEAIHRKQYNQAAWNTLYTAV
jgi:hypothetical protein